MVSAISYAQYHLCSWYPSPFLPFLPPLLPPFLPLFPPSLCPFLSPPSLIRHIPHNLPNLAGPCNIKRRNSSLSQQEFLEKLVTKVKTTQLSNTFLVFYFLVRFAYTEPVILTGMSDQSVSNHFQVKQWTSDIILGMLFELWLYSYNCQSNGYDFLMQYLFRI